MAISKVILNGEVQMDVTSDTVTAGSMLSGTTATKNDGTKATGTISSKSSSDLTASGATVTAPAGYYSANASKSVATMTLPTTTSTSATSGYTSKATLDRSTSDRYLNIAPGYNSAGGYYKINKVANGSVTAPSSISGTSATVSTGTNTLTLTKSVSVTPNVTTAGYISSGTAGSSSVSLTASVTTKAAATITPSTSEQSIAAGTYLTGKQTISAMPSGTAGTPTASKGSVSNHAVSVTPSVTNTTGYITGSTKTGTAVSVSASELVSGTKSITENGTGIDVTNYASVDVAVPTGPTYSVTITQAGSNSSYLKYNNVFYKDVGSISVSENDTIRIYLGTGDSNYLYINNVQVAGGSMQTVTYDYTVTTDVEIAFSPDIENTYAYITELSGGGASNYVTGTFTGTITGAAMDITIPYSGTGYPIAINVCVSEGASNGNGTFYNTIQQYAISFWMGNKDNTETPTYINGYSPNFFTISCRYKSSSTTASTTASGAATKISTLANIDAGSSSRDAVVKMKSSTVMSVYIASTSYGFMANTEYTYHIMYSE